MGVSPTENSLKWLRANGYVAQVTEKWNGHARIRQDLFGFCDVLAVRPGETLAIQTTSAPNVAARITKLLALPELRVCLDAGWSIRVHGWKKINGRWVLHRDEDLRVLSCALVCLDLS